MRFEPVEMKDRLGRTIVVRSAEPSDAAALLRFLKITAQETPFLIREADEISLTPEEEARFITRFLEAERELLLVATVAGKHVGNASLMSAGSCRRYAHRCSVAIALYRAYCGAGIGELLLNALLQEARRSGYEQAELEVVSHNTAAVSLYHRLGFVKHGQLPRNMKYANGSYADVDWMMKKLC